MLGSYTDALQIIASQITIACLREYQKIVHAFYRVEQMDDLLMILELHVKVCETVHLRQ